MERLRAISVREKLDAFSETWRPKVIARVNDRALKADKLDGEFIWHHHADDDEIFSRCTRRMDMHYRDSAGAEQVESFGDGELLMVPRGMEHKPVAAPGTELLLIERADVVNTGNATNSERTRAVQPL